MNNGNVAFDAIVPHMLSSLSDALIGIVVVLVLSASMSTLASLVMTSSSTLTLDFIKGNIVKKMSEKKQLLTMRILIVGFIILSVVIALYPPDFIPQLMGISWGALAGSFLAPFLYGLYWKRTTKAAVWASFITGVGITLTNLTIKYTGISVTNTFVKNVITSPINAGALAMVIGLIVVPVVSILTPKMNNDNIKEIFACYDETVTVHTKKSIEE
jgi:SSS family solute:Na+ symporter